MGFFDVVALPLYQALAAAFPRTQPLLGGAGRNHRYWLAQQQAAHAAAAAAGGHAHPHHTQGLPAPLALPPLGGRGPNS